MGTRMSAPARTPQSDGAGSADGPDAGTGASPGPTRRRLLVGGAAAVAASAAAAVTAVPASAANGGSLLLGRANSATAATGLSAVTTANALSVTNSSSGSAATLTSYLGHGSVSSTRAGNRWGAYALNSATANGGGGALLASGGKAIGALVVSSGVGVSALQATHTVPLASVNGNEAAVTAIGGAANGVVASTTNELSYGLVSTHFDGGTAVLGTSDGATAVGVMGIGTGGGSGVYAIADDVASFSLTADGTALFLGDVVVQGTLYAPNIQNALPVGMVGDKVQAATASARKVASRAARTAARIRASQVGG